MSVKRQTQTVTLTLSMNQDLNGYDSPLDALRDLFENDDYVEQQDFELEIVDRGEVITTGGRTDEQRARLLELKGWAFGEHQKQERDLPSEWDQGDWLKVQSCGTACCIAGKVVLEDGGQPADWSNTVAPVITFNSEDDYPVTFGSAIMPNGRNVDVGAYAAEVLGLDEEEAELLFNAQNDYDTVAEVIDELVANV